VLVRKRQEFVLPGDYAKANYIWPAMHVNSFNLTPENGALTDRMGIVVGTSHCDMLMRSNNREWKPWIQKKGYINVLYDYSIEERNREILRGRRI